MTLRRGRKVTDYDLKSAKRGRKRNFGKQKVTTRAKQTRMPNLL